MKNLMRKNRYIALAASILLLAAAVVGSVACTPLAPQTRADDLMIDISSNPVSGKAADDSFIATTADFSIGLFKRTIADGENILISPLSVLLALGMTANGAGNETLSQMQGVLGGNIPIDELNKYLYSYTKNLPSGDRAKLNIANSIWFRDDENHLTVEKGFLQKNADFYNADLFKSAFDDRTLSDVNDWVKNNTDGMIDKILDAIHEGAVMYLINAIVFDAEWESAYHKDNISEGEFTAFDGGRQRVDFMTSKEDVYLDDGRATGFIKPYINDTYSFVALLPNEDISVGEYVKSLTGEGFLNTLRGATDALVSATMPKFSYDYKIQMNDTLKDLGMTDAFSADRADFSRLGRSPGNNIYVFEVLHKTFISVDELGTKAGAVTKVEMRAASDHAVTKSVELDRPFVYAIIDNATLLPMFIGTVMTIGG